MIQPTKLGWMAGVVDMQGRFTEKDNKSRKGTKQISLFVETRHIQVIKELSSLTGISSENKRVNPLKDWMRRGCSEHCPEAHIHVEDEREIPIMGRWTISGGGLAVVLFNLMPFLLMDKDYQDRYDQILDESPLAGRGSGAVVASIRRLALLGWDLPKEYAGVEL